MTGLHLPFRFYGILRFQLMIAWLCFHFSVLGMESAVYAQETPPITSSGLNTVVTTTGNIHDITGGTRPGGESGTNLFHSFGEFGVPPNNIANFLNGVSFDLNGNQLAAGLPTSNILARVTGNIRSDIFGTIQTTGFENANLFLINPAGFLFGPNAMMNVGGVVSFTSADYLRLADNVIFNVTPNATIDALLTPSPVAAFGFLGSNPFLTITVQGSQFTVTEGTGISLVGGDITIEPGTPDDGTAQPAQFVYPGGQINLASITSAGEVSAFDFMPTSGMTMGNITLSQGATLDVSGNAAGTVRIRGGQFEMLNSSVHADTGEAPGAETTIDVRVTGDLSISSDSVSAFTARALGSGNAGEIRLDSAKMDVNLAFPEFGVVIDSSTVGSGNAGKVTVTTGDLKAVNTSTGGFGVFIDSGTGGTGRGGDVTIKVQNGDFLGAFINTGDSFFFGAGSAGNLYIGGTNGMADSLHIDGALLSTEAFSAKAGAITLEAHDISLAHNTTVSSISLLGENPITINADQLSMDTVVRVQAQTIGPGNGGDIVFTGKRLEMSNESSFDTSALGDGNAGNIRVKASEYVRFVEDPRNFTPTGLYSDSVGMEGVTTSGNAGSIHVITPKLEMTGGARINTTTHTAGRGGDVTITASEGIFISGQRTSPAPGDSFGLGEGNGSGIYTRTVGTDRCGETCGRGGDQIITTGHLVLQNGGVLDGGTTNNGNGGNIVVNASNDIVLSGTLIDGTPSGFFSRTIGTTPDSGIGGEIALTAGQSMVILDGASVSASSTGPGNAGNISIDAGNQLILQNSSITTEANQASGGKIDLRAKNLISLVQSTISTSVLDGAGGGGDIDIQVNEQLRLVNSIISASVLGGTGSGGNVRIDPNIVVLQNSQILAKAIQGAGGNITITTPLFLADQSSLVSASSQFGLNGTVRIQSPTSNLSGSLGPLTSKPSQAQSLLTQRCAALANGQASSFVVAGREQLPADPGGWLTSPLALAGLDTDPFNNETVAKGTSNLEPRTSSLSANGMVSLRRLTPARFLMANFADSEATGCHS
ncbi:MAG: filamentous hemagglutinin N-terminal domain-containing protein [Nitrospirota bacterium]